MQSLIESGSLAGHARRVPPGDAGRRRSQVPPTVQAVLAARIDRLPEREKQRAADGGGDRQGVHASRSLARGRRASPRTRAARRRSRRCSAREFVYETALYPVAEYAFKHPLTQEVALGSQLQRAPRGRSTRRWRAAIEALHADKLDEQAALLAHHWEEAGEAVAAARWHARAASAHRQQRPRAAQSPLAAASATLHDGARDPTSKPRRSRADACFGLVSTSFRVGRSSGGLEEILESGKLWAERAGSLEHAVRLEAVASGYRATSGDCAGGLRHARAAEKLAEGVADPLFRAAVALVGGVRRVQYGRRWTPPASVSTS